MRKERKEIGLGFILLNEGQLPWLPKNPRTWTQTDIDKTAASIKEDPDFLEDRPLLVVPFSARDYIVFAGNLRHEGSFAAKRSKVPCVVYYPEMEADQETICRRAMKDNGSFGKFDWDEVFSGPWGTMDLEAMGIGRAFEGSSPSGNEGYGKEGSSEGGEGGGIPGNLDAEPKNAPFVCKITFPDADSMTRFVNGYKNILEDEFGCSMSESGGEL